ncbi:hypothetical protein ACQKJC_20230 [Priestia koreensis]|uniref:hypothetical protein n=2 Tax=Priestia koreensis TaxID=284581 RepID=UPI003D06BF60
MTKGRLSLIFVVLLGSVAFVVIRNVQEANNASQYPLSSHQTEILNEAKVSKRGLSTDEIDRFTIGQGKFLLIQHLNLHHLDYRVGSKEYIRFLASISERKDLKENPTFVIIGSYASVYLSELQKKEPLFLRFHLPPDILNATIKEKERKLVIYNIP